MKKTFRFLPLIFISLALLGCPEGLLGRKNNTLENDDYYHKKVYKELFDALENGDREGLKALFSPDAKNRIADFDASVHAIFDFVTGKHITRSPYPQAGASKDSNRGEQQLTLESVSNFDLGGETYSMQFIYYVSNIDSEGRLHGISVIRISKYLGWDLNERDPGIYWNLTGNPEA